MSNPDPISTQVWLNSAARQTVDELCKESGMSRADLVQRLVEWFAEANHDVQAGILTRDPAKRKTLLVQGFHALLAAEVGKLEFEQMVGTMRTLLDEITSMHRTAVKFARSVNEPESKKRK